MAKTLRFASEQQYKAAWAYLVRCTKDFSYDTQGRELLVSDAIDEAVLNRLQEIQAGKYLYEV